MALLEGQTAFASALDILHAMKYPKMFGVAFTLFLLYWSFVYLYRITIHPLARFPGPKIAAMTFWYEFYYDVYPRQFQYLWKIKALHEQYGPIVRINPIHIHINDPDFLDPIYASGANHKRQRCPWYMHMDDSTPISGSMFQTRTWDLHRRRRQAFAGFFSKRSVQALEPLVLENVRKLIRRFLGEMEEGNVFNLSAAAAGLTMDVISGYSFGEEMSMGMLSEAGYGKYYLDTFHEGIQIRPMGRQFPWLINSALKMPTWALLWINPSMAPVMRYQEMLVRRVEQIVENRKRDGGSKEATTGRRTIFHDILDNQELPEKEKRATRLADEANVVIGAGTETTARTMSVILFYVYTVKEVQDALLDELKTVMPTLTSEVSTTKLEQLPYLTGVVNEGLRLAHGVSSRIPRVPIEEDLAYKQWVIPRGTAVMQSFYLLHTNEELYGPEPLKFRPQRWIENADLKKYLFAFARGSMSCLGMNLATSELFITIAHLVRRFEIEIVDTIEERDVWTTNDCFLGFTSLDSEGIKCKIPRERKG